MNLPSREKAYDLFLEYNKTESLIKHGLTVEGIMEHFASLYENENVSEWGIIGLVHDIDYEMFPSAHCEKAEEILTQADWPIEAIRAVKSHGYGICTDVKPESHNDFGSTKGPYSTKSTSKLGAPPIIVLCSICKFMSPPWSI